MGKISFVFLYVMMFGFAVNIMAQDLRDLSPAEQVVALTILGEARGEGPLGMYAVACVIQERSVERKLTPDAVCLQRKQFSIWNDRSREDLLRKVEHENPKVIAFAVMTARSLVRGDEFDRSVVGYANHYCVVGTNPYWARGLDPIAIIGNHEYYDI